MYDNNMEIILSKVVSDNPRAPALRVTFEINGQKYKAGLWPWERKDGSRVTDKDGNGKYKGKIEIDDYVPNQPANEPPPAPAQTAPAVEPDFGDDIPFSGEAA
jgi:hypothetical protein